MTPRHLKFALLLILPPLLFSCQQAEKAPTIEMLSASIEQLNEAMEKAYNSGQLQEVANFYSDDAHLLGPNHYHRQGRAAIDAYWLKIKSPIRWQLEVIKVARTEAELYQVDYWKKLPKKPPHWNTVQAPIRSEDDVVYQLGHSQLEYEREDATHQTSHVDFILVWKKQENGAYKIFIDTYQSNGPMGF
ncbi:MAG: hypothetical protein AAF985_10725 [Bacteroidota bacterium]